MWRCLILPAGRSRFATKPVAGRLGDDNADILLHYKKRRWVPLMSASLVPKMSE